jgi:hypothetical protein
MPHIWVEIPQVGQSTPGIFCTKDRGVPTIGIYIPLGDIIVALSSLDVAFGGP